MTAHLSNFVGKVDDVSKVQTLLFSATLPTWVKNVRFFLNISQNNFLWVFRVQSYA